MEYGKEICKYLKELRRDIADKNGIPLESTECSYDGPCEGTCPRCDSEILYLEREINRRSLLGKAAIVTTMTAALAAGGNAAAQEVPDKPYDNGKGKIEHLMKDSSIFHGIVYDSITRESLFGANIILYDKNDNLVTGSRANLDGEFSIKIPPGQYKAMITYVGYPSVKLNIDLASGENKFKAIALDSRQIRLHEGVVIRTSTSLFIEIGAPESGKRIDSETIKHFPTP